MTKNSFLLFAVAVPLLFMGAGCEARIAGHLGVGDSTSTSTSTSAVVTTNLPTTCTDQQEGVPVITSLSSFSGSVGTKLEIKGCNFSGFEGDKIAWMENDQGVKGFLHGEAGSTDKLLKVLLKSPLCQQDNSYSGAPCDAWLTLVPGTYKIFTTPWSKKSNAATFTIKDAAISATSLTPWATKACSANQFGNLNQGRGLKVSGQF